MTIRIFNDSSVEGDETFTVSFTVNPNGGDATEGNNNLTFTINDDDLDPNIGGAPISIFSDDFENGLGNWSVSGLGTSNFAVANNASFPDAGFFNSDGSNATNYVFVNDDSCNCDMNEERIAMSTSLDFSSYTAASVSFNYVHDNQYVNAEYAALEASIDGGTTWTEVESLVPDNVSGNSALLFQNATIDVSGYAGESDVRFSLFYSDGAGWGQGLIFDDFEVTTPGVSNIQIDVNDGSSADQIQVLGNGVSDAFDTVSNDVILSIEVTDGFNYGCTSASVSRSGNSGQSYNGSVAPALVMDKTFTVLPATTNPAGASTMSFYITEAELAGWETATSDSRNNLLIAKNNGSSSETVTATITPFGANHKVTGTFSTGIAGTYYFGNLALLSTSDFVFDNFGMFPNPANEQLTLKFNTNNDVELNFYDIRGRQVLSNSFKSQGSKFNQNIDVSSFSSGIYVIKIHSGVNTMFRKLVVD